jgi:dTDP-glucose 4,6-dehydratase
MSSPVDSASVLVTGGAGFVGSNFVVDAVSQHGWTVVNVDKLTYAGSLHNLEPLAGNPRHIFHQADIADRETIRQLLQQHRPLAIVHFAAETHVDRSIAGPEAFVATNIVGTFHLLVEACEYWRSLPAPEAKAFRFLHVSTDEVFGALTADAPGFTEQSRYLPNSPYAASKASSDHMVRAYNRTFGLPVLTTHCSNNYGPYQFPEKLIPLVICNALQGKPLPVYGNGRNIRDWLFVQDHCDGIRTVLARGQTGQCYNIGGCCELANLDVVNTLCRVLDELRPKPQGSYAAQIQFVTDRLGHDFRYATDTAKIHQELGWRPAESFETGIRKTVQWYLDHQDWVKQVTREAHGSDQDHSQKASV